MEKLVQAEYRALKAAGANHREAVHQIAVSYLVHTAHVEALLTYMD